jgi:hypothetical protein
MIVYATAIQAKNKKLSDNTDEKDLFITEYKEKFDQTFENFNLKYL